MHRCRCVCFFLIRQRRTVFGNRPNTVSESTVSNTELSEFFGPRQVTGRELSEFLSAYYLCAKANSPSLPQSSVSPHFQNSTLETVLRPFAKYSLQGDRMEDLLRSSLWFQEGFSEVAPRTSQNVALTWTISTLSFLFYFLA